MVIYQRIFFAVMVAFFVSGMSFLIEWWVLDGVSMGIAGVIAGVWTYRNLI